MKRAWLNFILFTLGAASLSLSCQKIQAECISIGESDAGKTLRVRRGQTICFKLPVLPANGYMWYPTYDPGALAQIGKTRFETADPRGKPGLEEVQSFQFQAKSLGVSSIR